LLFFPPCSQRAPMCIMLSHRRYYTHSFENRSFVTLLMSSRKHMCVRIVYLLARGHPQQAATLRRLASASKTTTTCYSTCVSPRTRSSLLLCHCCCKLGCNANPRPLELRLGLLLPLHQDVFSQDRVRCQLEAAPELASLQHRRGFLRFLLLNLGEGARRSFWLGLWHRCFQLFDHEEGPPIFVVIVLRPAP